MIPEYKLYHGAALAELVDHAHGAISIDELTEEGRLGSYILDHKVGVQIKHSAARMPPWQFTFSRANVLDLAQLRQRYKNVFIVLVCWVDGFVCLTLDETLNILQSGLSDQVWIRVERKRNEWYLITGSADVLGNRKPQGLADIIEALGKSPK